MLTRIRRPQSWLAKINRFRALPHWAIVLGLYAGSAAAAEPPTVVASIKPLHALISVVMEGVAVPTLLVKGGNSPHTYSLRPSDARALNRADLIFWIGDGIETFLRKPLDTLSENTTLVTVSELENVRLLPIRQGGIWEAHTDGIAATDRGASHDEPGRAETHDDHNGQQIAGDTGFDPDANLHLWLDPQNARAIVDAAAQALTRVDPANAATYEQNAARSLVMIDHIDDEVAQRLAGIMGRLFIVFHDAYQYFEDRYGLAGAGSVTVSADRAPGARRLSEIRKRIVDGAVACVFVEPQFEPRVITTIVDGTPARIGVLDPLGIDVAPGADAYRTLMTALADGFADCLAPRS